MAHGKQHLPAYRSGGWQDSIAKNLMNPVNKRNANSNAASGGGGRRVSSSDKRPTAAAAKARLAQIAKARADAKKRREQALARAAIKAGQK